MIILKLVGIILFFIFGFVPLSLGFTFGFLKDSFLSGIIWGELLYSKIYNNLFSDTIDY